MYIIWNEMCQSIYSGEDDGWTSYEAALSACCDGADMPAFHAEGKALVFGRANCARAEAALVRADAQDATDRAALALKMPVTTIEGHPLSLRNNILCVLQSPSPVTIVAGFRQWLTAGRCVRKGEKALYILYPCSKKDDSDARIFFREAAIFDVSQTEISEVAS